MSKVVTLIGYKKSRMTGDVFIEVDSHDNWLHLGKAGQGKEKFKYSGTVDEESFLKARRPLWEFPANFNDVPAGWICRWTTLEGAERKPKAKVEWKEEGGEKKEERMKKTVKRFHDEQVADQPKKKKKKTDNKEGGDKEKEKVKEKEKEKEKKTDNKEGGDKEKEPNKKKKKTDNKEGGDKEKEKEIKTKTEKKKKPTREKLSKEDEEKRRKQLDEIQRKAEAQDKARKEQARKEKEEKDRLEADERQRKQKDAEEKAEQKRLADIAAKEEQERLRNEALKEIKQDKPAGTQSGSDEVKDTENKTITPESSDSKAKSTEDEAESKSKVAEAESASQKPESSLPPKPESSLPEGDPLKSASPPLIDVDGVDTVPPKGIAPDAFFCRSTNNHSFDKGDFCIATLLEYATPGDNPTRQKIAVLAELKSKNMKNLNTRPRKLLITREGEEVISCGAVVKLSKQFLNWKQKDITDVKKTLFISRKVKVPGTNTTFRQFQFIGQKAIDADRSKAVGDCDPEVWDQEITPALALMSSPEPDPTTGVVPQRPLDTLPRIYDFVFIDDQPQVAGEWPNGRPKRVVKVKPEPTPPNQASKKPASKTSTSKAAAATKGSRKSKQGKQKKSKVPQLPQLPVEDDGSEEHKPEDDPESDDRSKPNDDHGPTPDHKEPPLTLQSITGVFEALLKQRQLVTSNPNCHHSAGPAANVSSASATNISPVDSYASQAETESEKKKLQAQANKLQEEIAILKQQLAHAQQASKPVVASVLRTGAQLLEEVDENVSSQNAVTHYSKSQPRILPTHARREAELWDYHLLVEQQMLAQQHKFARDTILKRMFY